MIIDALTGLEVRTCGSFVKDPDNDKLVCLLFENGIALSLEEWTDEEAERCRLAAFDLRERDGGRWFYNEARGDVIAAAIRGGGRRWVLDVAADESETNVLERFFSPFDWTDDFALDVSVPRAVQRELARGVELPMWCRRMNERAELEPAPWPELLSTARGRLAENALRIGARSKRKAARAEARP